MELVRIVDIDVLDFKRNFIDPLTNQEGQCIVELKNNNTYIKIINNIIIIVMIILAIQANPNLRT
jgi:hypothetical protein